MAERVFALPDLGEGLEEGTVATWLVAEGDEVELNQPIAEIETAKAVVEMPSPFAGRIVRLHVAAGSEAKVGSPLLTFEVAGEVAGVDGSARTVPGHGSSAPATPAVRKLAKELDVDLSTMQGTGPEGRVTRDDVERAASSPRIIEVPLGNSGHTWTVSLSSDVEEIPVTPVRRAIAERLGEVAAVPQVTTFRTVDCTELDGVRREMGVSPLPVFVRALAEVCQEHRMLNASWDDERMLVHRDVHVGVATDTDRGLVVPVVRDAGSIGISALAEEISRLAAAARGGALQVAETSGATIAVSNTGSYGSEAGTPLLNPGHAVTVALGVIEPRALVVEGTVEVRLACTISLTFDHRVLDGATVGRGLTALVELLESRGRLEQLPR